MISPETVLKMSSPHKFQRLKPANGISQVFSKRYDPSQGRTFSPNYQPRTSTVNELVNKTYTFLMYMTFCLFLFMSRSDVSFSVDGPNLDDVSHIYDHVESDYSPNLNGTDGTEKLKLSDYQLNQDTQPLIVNKKHNEGLQYNQEYAVRFLKPPTPPVPGEVIIHQKPNVQTKPAPPLIIREVPKRPITPEPLVIREAPPEPPKAIPVRCIRISGKL